MLTPLIERSQNIGKGSEAPRDPDLPDRIFTIPTALMTIPRPLIMGVAVRMLHKGIRPVTPVVFASLITDMEGAPARFIDEKWPESGLGTSSFGTEADIIADTAALVEVGLAALEAPRVPMLSKIAIGTVLGHEVVKGGWAMTAAANYTRQTGLRIKPATTVQGKASMAEKMIAVGAGVMASDFDNKAMRQGFSLVALTAAGFGTARAEQQRGFYSRYFEECYEKVAFLAAG